MVDVGRVTALELMVEVAVAGRGLGALGREDDEGRVDKGLVRETTLEAVAGLIGFEAGG